MRKGFTLVELLAVIVVLAIISLIATPALTKVVSNAKKSASLESARGYIEAINNQILSNDLDMSDEIIKDGTYNSTNLKVEAKGQKPSNAIIVIEKNQVKEARLCMGKYSIDYDGKNYTDSSNDYCGDTKVTLVSNGKKVSSTSKGDNSYTVDLKGITNINCNNGAIPEVSGNTLTVKNTIGNTTCELSSSLKNTFSHLNDGDNNIIMVSNEEINDKIRVESDQKANINLNGKILKLFAFFVTGKLNVYDENKQGKVIGTNDNTFNLGGTNASVVIKNINVENDVANGIWSSGVCEKCYVDVYNSDIKAVGYVVGMHESAVNSVINIYGDSNIEGTKNPTILNNGNNTFNIYDGKISSETSLAVANRTTGTINIYGGTFISNNSVIVNQSTGTININQTSNPIYIRSDAKGWNPAIVNKDTGIVNINGNSADKCTNNPSDTKKGLCVYADADGITNNNVGNGDVRNESTGVTNINGGTFYADYQNVNSHGLGIINVKKAILFGALPILNHQTGTVNICNSKINSFIRDLSNSNSGIINYDSKTIFTNGTNIPSIRNTSGTINANYMGTCTE